MSEKDTTTAVAPRFYTLQELTDLGVGSESTLRKAIKEGRLSFHRFGTAYRIRQDDLDALPRGRTPPCPAAIRRLRRCRRECSAPTDR